MSAGDASRALQDRFRGRRRTTSSAASASTVCLVVWCATAVRWSTGASAFSVGSSTRTRASNPRRVVEVGRRGGGRYDLATLAVANAGNDGGGVGDETPTVDDDDDDADNVVAVGSKEYYSGFLSRRSVDEPEERVTGDVVLIPSLKFAGLFSVALGALMLAFLYSNDLL